MRIVLVLTTKCGLRCPYCVVAKDGRTMTEEVMEAAVEAALHPDVPLPEIQFFGGEPLDEKWLLFKSIEHAELMAMKKGRSVKFHISTNALGIDEEFIRWISKKKISFEVSIDGSAGPVEIASDAGGKPWNFNRAAEGARLLLREDIECFANVVVTPQSVPFLKSNFEEIVGLGFSKVHISPATGIRWPKPDVEILASQLWEIFNQHVRGNRNLRLLNLEASSAELLLFNREVTVDCDGAVYSGNSFLYAGDSVARQMRLGHVFEKLSISNYHKKRLPLNFFLSNIFDPATTFEYLVLTKMINGFITHVKKMKLPPSAG
ncbi:MAG: radical SAM protein [bacterium]